MANPVPEILPEQARGHVRVIATGRTTPTGATTGSASPGFSAGRSKLGVEYILPSVFDKRLAPAVAEAVARTAWGTGVARHRRSRFGVLVSR